MTGADLISNGEIVLDGDILPHEWCQWPDESCFSSRMVREALAAFTGDVTIRVNSGGGAAYEGEGIRAAIEAHPGKVTVIVAGLAASAASLMIMSADTIQMTAGSLLMIHDPSASIYGSAEEMRREAEVLDTISQTYAKVYAARSGLSVEEVRAMMIAETWMGAEEAVAAGFADAIVRSVAAAEDVAPEVVAMRAVHEKTLSTLRMCAARAKSSPETPAAEPVAAGDHSPVTMATTEGNGPMSGTNQTTTPADDAVQSPPPVASHTGASLYAPVVTEMTDAQMSAARTAGMEAERTRQRAIREMAAPYMSDGSLTEAQVQIVIDEGTTAEAAGSRFLAVMAANRPPAPRSGAAPARARGEGGAHDPQMEGMIQALMGDYSGPGQDFRGLRVRNLAMHLAGRSTGFSDAEMVRRGMTTTAIMGGAHGVSDFAYISTEVMNRTLVREYERRGSPWQIVTGEVQRAADFREMHAVRFGGDFALKPVKENGEYEEAVLEDAANGLKVERFGRKISLTFEAVVNDDMGAFNRIPREFAWAARSKESAIVWGVLRDNLVLGETGNALFSTQHKNLGNPAAQISVASVGLGRKAMWEQVPFGSKSKEDFLLIEPTHLIVPPSLETTARQFVANTTPTKDDETNPYKSLTPVTVPHLGNFAGGSDTAWYLISEDLPPVAAARLDGYDAPTVTTIEGMNPDKITMQARHMFGAAADEFRGAFKNAGQ